MDDLTFEEHSLTLVRKRLSMTQILPRDLIEASIDADSMMSYFTDDVLLRFKAAILGEELPPATDTAHEQVPLTWWDHFKADHAERWWLRSLVRRRPPRARTITLTTTWENMAAYPWAQLRTQPVPPSLGDPVWLSWMTSTVKRGDEAAD